ncbi:MAG TPA: hypothetical protein VGL93_00835 [Streptosporangiaceae bacterium]|jgi:hypothetical protein
MDLLKPWLAAFGTWIAATVIAALATAGWVTGTQLESSVDVVLWVVVPQMLVAGAAAAAASYAHRRPFRDAVGRSALAGLGGVATLAVLQAAVNLMTSTVLWAVAVAFVAQACGGVLGWLFVSRGARHREHAELVAAGGYTA